MGIDVWEVIDAAKTKPFGFMAFYPGPGLGGHCIPIDPFYLTWKAREYEISTKFIELAGEINTSMPNHVVARLGLALDRFLQRGFCRTEIVVVGIAYKKNIDDMRESPALRIIEQLEEREAHVSYYDPLVPVLPPTREHARLAGRRSVSLDDITRRRFAAAVIVTDHDDVDYDAILDNVDGGGRHPQCLRPTRRRRRQDREGVSGRRSREKAAELPMSSRLPHNI